MRAFDTEAEAKLAADEWRADGTACLVHKHGDRWVVATPGAPWHLMVDDINE